MNTRLILTALLLAAPLISKAADAPAPAPAKPVLKIIPGKVIVPTDAMRRIWGELISVDPATRTGKFRQEGTDEIMPFTALPYAELLHHAANGDLQDFRIGERAIFRMHENDKGEWVWLTYIQDQMNMMNGHKEYFHVDGIDAAKGALNVTQANGDKSYVREKDILIETDKDTRYWLKGVPVKFTEIKIGDRLRTKTHGIGKGKTQMSWEVFLDDESLAKFQDEQKGVHAKRMQEEGAPGYVDEIGGQELKLTLFGEADEISKALKAGKAIRVAPAGVDRKASGAGLAGKVTSTKQRGKLCEVTLTLDSAPGGFKVAGLARLWIAK